MSPDEIVSLELLPEEIRENRPDFTIVPKPSIETDPQSELRQAVLRYLSTCRDRSGIRDVLLGTVEETLLRYLLDSGRYSQRELAALLTMSRATLRKKLAQYGLS